MGFIPDIHVASTNLSYTQMVQTVADGVYDLVIGDVTVTSSRREIISFSNAIYDNSLRIVIRKDVHADVDLLSFLKPFSTNLWLLILCTNIYAGILFGLLERDENEALKSRSFISLFTMSIWYCFGHIAGYGSDFDCRTAAGRLITAGLYILSVVLVVSYTANLASDLTILKSKNIISGLDDIKSGMVPFNRIGIRVGSASEDFYLREISDGKKNYFPLKNKQETYDCLLNGTIDLSIMDIGVAEYITNNIYCNLTLIGEDFNKGIMAIVMPKQWLYEQELDIKILAFRELGYLDDLKVKWIQTKNCPDSSQTSTAMEIKSMSGLFMIFVVITLISIILYAWKKRHFIQNCTVHLFTSNNH